MKIMINHLGPVIESKIDLKPLTIFVGPNNMGKTWLAYSIVSCPSAPFLSRKGKPRKGTDVSVVEAKALSARGK